MPITVPKSVRCSLLFGSVVLFKFNISFRILTTVLFRATLKYILNLKSEIRQSGPGVWDVFGFHVSYTRELFPAELNAPAPRTVSVCDRAKVTTLPPRE